MKQAKQTLEEMISDAASIMEMYHAANDAGYWMLLKSPFTPDGNWIAGFTPHNCSGWNGRPDFEGHGKTKLEAVRMAFEAWEKRDND